MGGRGGGNKEERWGSDGRWGGIIFIIWLISRPVFGDGGQLRAVSQDEWTSGKQAADWRP